VTHDIELERSTGAPPAQASRPAAGRFGEWRATRHLASLADLILRYGLAALLLFWGSLKFAAFESEAIRPRLENSPLLSWPLEAAS
jgi:hypothetical protein